MGTAPVRTPANRTVALDSIDVTFSRPIDPATLDAADFSLTRDGGADLLETAAGVSLMWIDAQTLRVAGLGSVTGAVGVYEFSILASGVVDTAGNALAAEFSVGWGAGAESRRRCRDPCNRRRGAVHAADSHSRDWRRYRQYHGS